MTKKNVVKPRMVEIATTNMKKMPRPIVRGGLASATNDYMNYRNIVPNISVRNTYGEDSYSWFRPGEDLPTTPKGLMAMGMSFYKKNPIVKNTIDTMAEFAANGMVVPHKSETIQDFYKNYLIKVDSYHVNEQFVRLLLKSGVTPIHRSFAKVNKAQMKELTVGLAADQDFPEIEVVNKEIPLSYSFLNPLSITMPNEKISLFLGKKNYYVEMPEELVKQAQKMNKKQLAEFVKEFPPDIAKALRAGETKIAIDPRRTSIYHYKKDDFEVWGEPVHACIFDDLIIFEKTRLADKTTLDSLTSRIRLWKLGFLDKEYSIYPAEGAYDELTSILGSIPSGGVVDVIWDAAISVEELSKDAWQSLNQDKYKAPLSAIYQGLGVPRTVNDDNSFNNSFFGLKTMVERLNYVRNTLKDFWNGEFKLIHEAMGLPGNPPEVYFDEISITDRSQMMALVRDLCDRNVISEEETRRLFNTDPEIEAYRIKKQSRRQTKGTNPPKAGPFHNSNHKQELEKIALTKGVTKPKDVGVDSSLTDKQLMNVIAPKPKGQPGQGRPKNKKDSGVRKKRVVKPRSAMANLWYTNAQSKIHELTLAKYLEKFGKKNYRQLSTASTEDLERDVLGYLYNLPYNTKPEEITLNGLSNSLPESVTEHYNSLLGQYTKEFGRAPNIDERRILNIEVCLQKE